MWRWDAPAPLPDDLPRLAAWVEAATGLELDERGSIRMLDRSAWLERRSRLEQLGGCSWSAPARPTSRPERLSRLEQLGGPPPDPAPRLDPILFGPDPAARGDAWRERGQWDRAEASYLEALRARPLDRSALEALVRWHAGRGHLDRAAATVAEAVRQIPDSPELRERLAEALLAAGDQAGWRRSIASALDRFGGATHAGTVNHVAWACALGPEAAVDPGVAVRLAELAVRGAGAWDKPKWLNTLALALYRAGRYDEAIRRLDEAARGGGGSGESVVYDWPMLAMAHHRLGHREEARRWLDRLRQYQPSTDPAQFWDDLMIRLLRSEAEAVVLYDPAFPEDPFAR
jgi:tetratricopeptide (TPR) repeat protein